MAEMECMGLALIAGAYLSPTMLTKAKDKSRYRS